MVGSEVSGGGWPRQVTAWIVAGGAAVSSVPLAARGQVVWSAVAFTLGGAAAFVAARLHSPAVARPIAEQQLTPESPLAESQVGAAATSVEWDDEHLRRVLAGTFGISGQLHIAALALPPVLLLAALGFLVSEGLYLAAAWAVVIGLFVTWVGWRAGLKYDRAAPKDPDLRMLEVGLLWLSLVVLVLGAGLLVWLLGLSLGSGQRGDALAIGATLIAGIGFVGTYTARLFARRLAN